MTRAGFGLRSMLVAGIAVSAGSMAACGGSSSAAAASPASTASTSQGVINRSSPTATSTQPTIAGVPGVTAVAGQPYSFQPRVANASGTVQFSIAHLPAWAKFNTSTGQLSGTPAASNVGQYPGITIKLVSGSNVVALPAFTITVAAGASKSNTVTLSWQAPTENSDGSALMDLRGYKVHYGATSKGYSDTIQVANPGLTTYVVQNLPRGTYYFAVTAYNSSGKESSLSGEVSTQVD